MSLKEHFSKFMEAGADLARGVAEETGQRVADFMPGACPPTAGGRSPSIRVTAITSLTASPAGRISSLTAPWALPPSRGS
jgi:hypothetical protein